jgi:HEAT repeat protein
MSIKHVVASALVLALMAGGTPARAETPKQKAEKLIKKLSTSKKAEERADAAEELGNLGAWDAVPALGAALKDPDSHVRANAIYALAELKDAAKDAVPQVKGVLADSDPLVRYNAVIILNNLKAATPAELAPAVISLLKDGDDDTRGTVVKILVGLGLDDPGVRAAVFDGLDHGAPRVRTLLLDRVTSREVMRSKAAWQGELIQKVAAIAAGDTDPKLRTTAVLALGSVRPLTPNVSQALLKALDDADPKVAHAAAGAINSVEGPTLAPQAVTHLTQGLKSADPAARIAAARALGGMIGWRERFSPALVSVMLTDKDPAVRAAAVEAVGEAGDDDTLAPLIKALKTDSTPRVRRAVLLVFSDSRRKLYLARAGQLEAALAAIDAAAKDEDDLVRNAAAAASEAMRR